MSPVSSWIRVLISLAAAAHLAGRMGDDLMIVLEIHAERLLSDTARVHFLGVVGGFEAFVSYKIEVVKDQCHPSQ